MASLVVIYRALCLVVMEETMPSFFLKTIFIMERELAIAHVSSF